MPMLDSSAILASGLQDLASLRIQKPRFASHGAWLTLEDSGLPVSVSGELLALLWSPYVGPQDAEGVFNANRKLIIEMALMKIAAGDESPIILGVEDYTG